MCLISIELVLFLESVQSFSNLCANIVNKTGSINCAGINHENSSSYVVLVGH